jgi:hypothetical protein
MRGARLGSPPCGPTRSRVRRSAHLGWLRFASPPASRRRAAGRSLPSVARGGQLRGPPPGLPLPGPMRRRSQARFLGAPGDISRRPWRQFALAASSVHRLRAVPSQPQSGQGQRQRGNRCYGARRPAQPLLIRSPALPPRRFASNDPARLYSLLSVLCASNFVPAFHQEG